MFSELVLTLCLLTYHLPAAAAAAGVPTTPATMAAQVKAFPDSSNRVITNSPKLDLFLNVPAQCDRAYDNLIRALQKCKSGEDRGHPDLNNGCLIHLDLTSPAFRCGSGQRKGPRPDYPTAIIFPKIGKTPWHPTPKCAGPDCVREKTPIWSGDDTEVDYPPNDAEIIESDEEVIEFLRKMLFKRRS